ncbi:hypothetical protein MJO28_007288 [Puccinia striiformis f. sp. tritici]|uniref:Uncharacterized protein n=1 Tax=Puccinia striiformis f. sp. tritici TaxID=168172 RepID=A0ACC0EDM1_9BASI|nr:hypothetical protein MJO28_007288 [Puccinia striiformis f. sp. tritici]
MISRYPTEMVFIAPPLLLLLLAASSLATTAESTTGIVKRHGSDRQVIGRGVVQKNDILGGRTNSGVHIP